MVEQQNDIPNKVESAEQTNSFPQQTDRMAIGYGGQLAILIGFIGIGFVLAALATVLLWMGLTKTSVFEMQKNMTNPAFSKPLEIIQLVSSALMLFFPAAMFAVVVDKKPFNYLGFNTRISIKQIFLVILIAVTALFISSSLGIINELIPIPKSWKLYFHQKEDEYNDAVEAMVSMKTIADYLISLCVIALAPAIFEESFFRGGLQQFFVKWSKNVWFGILFTSVIFSAIHLSYYGFLARAALGVILGLIFYYGKNIWLNILAHFLNNGIALTQLFFLVKSGKNIKELMNDDSMPFVSGRASALTAIAFLIIGIFIVYLLFKEFKKECLRLGVNKIDNAIHPDNNPFEIE